MARPHGDRYRYRFVLKRPRPILEPKFHLPANRKLDLPSACRSAAFGIGWGITGFCPGERYRPRAAEPSAWIFVGSMLAGIAAAVPSASRSSSVAPSTEGKDTR